MANECKSQPRFSSSKEWNERKIQSLLKVNKLEVVLVVQKSETKKKIL